MHRLFPVLVVLAALAACGGSPTGPDEDTLTLGTGLGHGVVTGTGDSFAIPAGGEGVLIHWALETRYDIGGGRAIALLIEQKTGDTFTERRFFEYGILENDAVYYYIESFYHQFGTGTFRATAFVGLEPVASRVYTVAPS